MTLILEIAVGIVLAVIILAFLPEIFIFGIIAIVLVILLTIAISIVGFVIDLFPTSHAPTPAPTVNQVSYPDRMLPLASETPKGGRVTYVEEQQRAADQKWADSVLELINQLPLASLKAELATREKEWMADVANETDPAEKLRLDNIATTALSFYRDRIAMLEQQEQASNSNPLMRVRGKDGKLYWVYKDEFERNDYGFFMVEKDYDPAIWNPVQEQQLKPAPVATVTVEPITKAPDRPVKAPAKAKPPQILPESYVDPRGAFAD